MARELPSGMSFVKSANTSVPVARSRAELERVLRRYGCTGFGSSQDFKEHRIIVHFVVPDTVEEDAEQIPVRLEVDVRLVCDHLYGWDARGYNEREWAQAERVAWRQLILWVDAACSAAAAGVQKMSEAFFAHTVVRGDDGVARRLVDHLDALSGGNWRALLSSGTTNEGR
jgi:hypothetical protein